MKVLFAVNNDEISNEILKKYQSEYKEILSYKNVYYFNAILKELQKDKSYDRVVISEDLEPFANNNYDTIDKFLFDKLDSISDEATNNEGSNTEIILICTDRRTKSDEMVTKLFSIGIYSALIGQERTIKQVCALINKPRTKKEAKYYYKIETENVGYISENEESVSEAEVQNILAHYKRLGKNEDKYVDSFNNIVSQYTDTQLKIIIKYLPMGVKAVLEERSPKYQELVEQSPRAKAQFSQYKPSKKEKKPEEKIKVEMLENESDRKKITKPILIPSGVNKNNVTKLIDEKEIKAKPVVDLEEIETEELVEMPKRGRGRPRKNVLENEPQEEKPKRGRGRPRKNAIENDIEEKNEEEFVDLFDLDEEPKESINETEEVDLFSLDDEEITANNNENDNIDLFNLEEENDNNDEVNLFDLDEEELVEKDDDYEEEEEQEQEERPVNSIAQTQYKPISADFSSLLTKDKKVVSFVGTTKNGTSFIVNNAACMLASMGIPTAILDMTKTRNAYYIYTNSEEKLMSIAKDSINKLKSGIAEGVRINKNLDVYTSLPEDNNEENQSVDTILSTLLKNYSVILIDCDFDTPMEYFDASQEVYLVQSMDVLTIQPLTAFLRNLQSKGILKQEKLKIVINKGVKIRSVTVKTLIGGISKYNDPSMTYMKDLFDKDKVPYCIIPFETQNYIKYLDSLITCSVTLNGYTKAFISAIKELCNMIYPLINRQTYSPRGNKYKDNFSSEMNDTLNKMRRKYQ